MDELAALEMASRYRQLAQFYGEAKKVGRSKTAEDHYTRLYELCELRAYGLETAIVGEPEENGGQIYESGNLPAVA